MLGDILDAAKLVVGTLVAIKTAWDDVEEEDVKVKEITRRLGSLAPEILKWAQTQSEGSSARELISGVQQDVNAIDAWMKEYKATGDTFVDRAIKMRDNAKDSALAYVGRGNGSEFTRLQGIMEGFEIKLAEMQIHVVFELAAGVDNIQRQQNQMMDMLKNMSQVILFWCDGCECLCNNRDKRGKVLCVVSGSGKGCLCGCVN